MTITLPWPRGAGWRLTITPSLRLGMVSEAAQSPAHFARFFQLQAGDHQVGTGREDARADRRDLRGALALAEDHFRHAAAQRAMLVDLGEAEILEGQMAQALERRRRVQPARRDLLQELAQTLLSHGECSRVMANACWLAPARLFGAQRPRRGDQKLAHGAGVGAHHGESCFACLELFAGAGDVT